MSRAERLVLHDAAEAECSAATRHLVESLTAARHIEHSEGDKREEVQCHPLRHASSGCVPAPLEVREGRRIPR